MDKNNVIELERRVKSAVPLTELLRSGAKQLLAKHQDRRTESGHNSMYANPRFFFILKRKYVK